MPSSFKLEYRGGGTNFDAAFALATNYTSMIDEDKETPVIVFMTDGDGTYSKSGKDCLTDFRSSFGGRGLLFAVGYGGGTNTSRLIEIIRDANDGADANGFRAINGKNVKLLNTSTNCA